MARDEHDNWLMTAEHVSGGTPPTIAELDTPAWSGCDVRTHTPVEADWSKALHDRGIRSMPYLNFSYEYASAYEIGPTPPFAVIDQLNRPQLHENYLRHDGKLIYATCNNTTAARDITLKRAEEMMKCGCDGLFLDNAAPSPKCWGPHFNQHEHIYAGDPKARAQGHRPFTYSKAARNHRHAIPIADEEQTYASAMLLKEIRDLVRSHCADGRIMINLGDGSATPPLFFEHVDSVMNEMFVYTTYGDCNFPVPTDLDYQEHSIMDWLSVLEWEDPFHRAGVRMANLSAFSDLDPKRKDHALYAFCASKLYDALFYTHEATDTDAWLREIRLGRPLTDHPDSWGAVLYREYENGLVVLNPYGIAQQAVVPWTNKPAEYVAHYDEPLQSAISESNDPNAKGTITVKLTPDHCALIVPRD